MSFFRTLSYYSRRFVSYHIATYAASASFFIITAVFPLMMLVLNIVSMTPLSTEDLLDMIAMVLPESLEPFFLRITDEMMTTSATALSVSLIATLWTAGKSMLGLLDGLNAIADVNDTRNFILKRILCIGYMLMLILGLIVNLALRVFGQRIQALLSQTFPYLGEIFRIIMNQRGLTLFLIMMVVFMLIYTAFPNKKLSFLVQAPGAAFTSLAWMGFSALFSVYVNRFGRFSVLYGGLTMMILAMVWLYFCMYIVFIGAVINKIYPEFFWKGYVMIKRRRERRWVARELRRQRRMERRAVSMAEKEARKAQRQQAQRPRPDKQSPPPEPDQQESS